ncbi:MAG TPA: DinB family protein [Chloroflexota bacterium]|jgi:uncharacterized damage-inducible protein DinB|nr:DinB family protein [Chloroflexota bacterium]
MTKAARRRLVVETPAAVAPEVGPWLWALDDCRHRTLTVLEGLSDAHVDRAGVDGATIGTLLYHIALIESSWLYEDILAQPFPEVEAYFPQAVRDANGRLQPVTGQTLAEHLRRLEAIRAVLREHLSRMTGDDLARVRRLPEYDVSPGWVLHHLLQHEAEHRGAIAALAGRAAD